MQPDVSFLEGHDLAVYASERCADCRRLKRFLDSRGIPYREVDIEGEPSAVERLEAETGKRAIPFLLVDERAWVRGYHVELTSRLDPGLLFDELRGALA